MLWIHLVNGSLLSGILLGYIRQYLETFLRLQLGGASGVRGIETGDTAQHSIPTKNYQAQNVNSVLLRNPM